MENSDWYSPNLSTTDPNNDGNNASTTLTPEVTATARNCSWPRPSLPSFAGQEPEEALVLASIVGLYAVFGLCCTFFGYRCFKAVMYFTGFIFASIVVYLVRNGGLMTLLN